MPRHRVQIPLRWSDVDAYGHVNNVQFLRLLEDARVLAFGARSDGGAGQGDSMVATGLLVARSEIEYLAPLDFSTTPVTIDLWVTAIGGADFELAYEVLDPHGDGAQVCAQAATTMVAYDLAGGRPRRLTPAERSRLSGWLDGPIAWRRRRPADRDA